MFLLPIENDIKKEDSDVNPWSVDDASAFLKYCCPECDYHEGDLKVFSNHALENHERSSTLFNDEKSNGTHMVPKTENDFSGDDIQGESNLFDLTDLISEWNE